MSDLGNKEIMAKNIRHYMDINNVTRQDMCVALGVKYTTLTDWIKGNSYPRIDKIELMANYFGINKSDLVEEKKSSALDYLDTQTIKQLNRANIDKVNLYSRNLLDIQKIEDKSYLEVQAAHERTDLEITNEMIQHDNDIMDNF